MRDKSEVSPFFMILILVLASCATPPELENYPKREVDRPYTLPAGLVTWKILFTAFFDLPPVDRPQGFGGIFPFNWEQGLTERVTLTWSPLPFQVRYQFYRGLDSYMGFYFNFLGPTYGRGDDFNWSPTLHGTFRKTFSTFWAVESTLLLEPEIKKDDPLGSSTVGIEIGVWTQIFDQAAFAVKQDFLWETGDPRSRYFGQLPPFRSGRSRPIFPFYLQIQTILATQWQFELEYRFLSIPLADHFVNHQFFGGLSYFW